MDINNEISKLDWKREPYGLYEPIEYTLAAGGKRVRPQLAMIASQLFGGKDEEVLPAALALEVFRPTLFLFALKSSASLPTK